ncbi:ExbD/TolR family protein [Rhizomicrobium electricum]|jgi:biopolymer transport protein ExbD|uniref:Biopolymer transporter ExbD n=1 Tax=Rhizomicrobium electricum TaxID=480070 RepID=A0ABN1EYJ8_9PROT|nr:biopolymer transporter ExbD [Rhizomicrobium electricum]NIJ49819.1 biopolymer transport protein ExbD [Rhizomicrobium electricum]
MAGMSTKQAEGDPMMEINMTPLIDVMLVLLTLLIITLPIQTHAVKLDMPRPNPSANKPLIDIPKVKLTIDFDGTILWNGSPVDRATLNGYFLDASTQDPQPEIHLEPNKLAKYDVVAKVLADAQRLGVKKIGFTGLDQYMQ